MGGLALGKGKWGRGWEGQGRTFGGIARLVLAPVAEHLILDPGHVLCVGFVVLFLGPLGHGRGLSSRACLCLCLCLLLRELCVLGLKVCGGVEGSGIGEVWRREVVEKERL